MQETLPVCLAVYGRLCGGRLEHRPTSDSGPGVARAILAAFKLVELLST